MTTKLETFEKTQLKKGPADVRPGDTVKVYQKIKETPKKDKSSAGREDKERNQTFEGVLIARKHGKGVSATITVRKVIAGIGVEKVFPIHSPTIEKIEVLKRGKVRRAKLYYLRRARGKKAKLKRREFIAAVAEEEPFPAEAPAPASTETKDAVPKEVSTEKSS